MIKFVLLVNKQGQTRLSRYAVGARPPPALRAAFEGEVVRKCLTRSDKQVRREEGKPMMMGSPWHHRRVRALFLSSFGSIYFALAAEPRRHHAREPGEDKSIETRTRRDQNGGSASS